MSEALVEKLSTFRKRLRCLLLHWGWHVLTPEGWRCDDCGETWPGFIDVE